MRILSQLTIWALFCQSTLGFRLQRRVKATVRNAGADASQDDFAQLDVSQMDELLHRIDKVDAGPAMDYTVIVGMFSMGVLLLALVSWRSFNFWKSRQKSLCQAEEKQQKHDAWKRLVDPIDITICELSGKPLVSLSAEPCWSCQHVKELACQSATPGEYVHSLVLDDGLCARVLNDRETIDGLGLAHGARIQVILASYSMLPSYVSYFSCSKALPGQVGSFMRASAWIHEDNSVSIECIDSEDVGSHGVVHLEGHLDEQSGILQFRRENYLEVEEFTGVLDQTCARKAITDLCLPGLGCVDLKQNPVEANFDLSQHPLFEGWMTFFQNGEVVAKVATRGAEEPQSLYLRLKASFNQSVEESSGESLLKTCIFLRKDADFKDWTQASAHGRHNGARTEYTGSWHGPIGKRRLTLVDFLFLGNIDLVESPL